MVYEQSETRRERIRGALQNVLEQVTAASATRPEGPFSEEGRPDG